MSSSDPSQNPSSLSAVAAAGLKILSRLSVPALFLVAAFAALSRAHAQIEWTNPGEGLFDTGSNWAGGVVPNSSNGYAEADVTNSGTADIVNGDSITVNEIWAGDNNDGTSLGTFNQTGGTLNVLAWFDIGRFGATGFYNMSGGIVNYDELGNGGNMNLGDGNGTLSMSGTAVFNQYGGALNIANTAGETGTLNMTGSSAYNVNSNLYGAGINIGNGGAGTVNLGGNAIFSLTGTNFVAMNVLRGSNINISGSGQMVLSGNDEIDLGTANINGVSESGTMNISQNGLFSVTHFFGVGRAGGTGVLNINGGTVIKYDDGDRMAVASQDGNDTGTVNVTAGVLDDYGDLDMSGGGNDNAYLNISGGTVNIGTQGDQHALILYGNGNGDSAEVTVSSTGSMIINGGLLMSGSNDSFAINGGAVTANYGVVGGYANTHNAFGLTSGTLNITNGGGYVWVLGNTGTGGTSTFNQSGGLLDMTGGGDIDIGSGWTGIMNTSGGAVDAEFVHVGDYSGGAGTWNISGSAAVDINAGLEIADNGSYSSAVNLNGGTLIVYGGGSENAYIHSSTGTFAFNGGTIEAAHGNGTLVQNNGGGSILVQAGGAVVNTTGFIETLNSGGGLIHDPALGGTADGGLTVNGGGTLTLTGSNTYTGVTTVQAGTTLALSSTTNNNIPNSAKIIAGDLSGDTSATLDVSGLSNGLLQVQAGQTLAGYGQVNGNVELLSSAILSPGNGGIGALTMESNLTLDSGSKFVFTLGSTVNSDQVIVDNFLTLNGQQFSDFTFNASAGFGPGSYTLIDASYAYQFGQSVFGSLGSNLTGTVDGYSATLSETGSSYITLTVTNAVPEPSTWAMMFAGVGTLALIGRRKGKRD